MLIVFLFFSLPPGILQKAFWKCPSILPLNICLLPNSNWPHGLEGVYKGGHYNTLFTLLDW